MKTVAKTEIGRKERLWVLSSFLLLSAIYVILASDTTSPLYATAPMRVPSADSGTFQVIGRYWLTEGVLPYKELFDQKGPFIFLINGLGWLLTDNVHGVCVFQTLAVGTALYLSYLTVRTEYDMCFSLLTVLCTFFVLSMLYGQGNTVEEFNLPLTAAALMGFFRYARQQEAEPETDHAPGWAYVYGLAVAWYLLCRGSDAIPVCLGILILGVYLLIKGKIKNLLLNILFGLLGMASFLIPFLIYFSRQGILEEFWYGTIGFNLRYIGTDTGSWIREASVFSLGKLCFLALPILSLLAAGVMALLKRRILRGFLWIAFAVSAAAFYVTSRGYHHYLITFTPYFPVALGELYDLWARDSEKRSVLLRRATAALLLMLACLGGKQGCNYLETAQFFWTPEPHMPLMDLVDRIPREDRNKIVFYNMLASYYLAADIRPCCRYFAFQDWQGNISPEMMDRITGELKAGKAKWVIACAPVGREAMMVLEECYEPVAEAGELVLYQWDGSEHNN